MTYGQNPGASSEIRTKVTTDDALREAERAAWGVAADPIGQMPTLLSADPFEGWGGGACTNVYTDAMNKLTWEDMPLDAEIVDSHRAWVDNRRTWSGISKYLQESLEPVPDWIGIKPGGIGPPEPVPQYCGRAELTSWGPSDFVGFVTTQRRRCGNPIVSPEQMVTCSGTNGFAMYGF